MRKPAPSKQTLSLSMPTLAQPATSWRGGSGPSSRTALPTPGIAIELHGAAKKSSTSYWRQVLVLAALVVFSATSYLAVSHYVITAVVIQGRSMSPTLHDGDHCFMDRWTLKHRDPVRGDLVVIRDPGHDDYAVKRIVGMPGEVVMIKDGCVYVDGKRLLETYLDGNVRTYAPKAKEQLILLGQAHYFVLGDNRPVSEDSRMYGPLKRTAIVGLLSH
jgi:signal peptidase I